jgi:hypothetical protein
MEECEDSPPHQVHQVSAAQQQQSTLHQAQPALSNYQLYSPTSLLPKDVVNIQLPLSNSVETSNEAVTTGTSVYTIFPNNVLEQLASSLTSSIETTVANTPVPNVITTSVPSVTTQSISVVSANTNTAKALETSSESQSLSTIEQSQIF